MDTYDDLYTTIYKAWTKCTDEALKNKLDAALDILANIDSVAAIAK